MPRVSVSVQAKVTPMPTYLVVIRLLMDYCCREPAWSPVSQWVCSSASVLVTSSPAATAHLVSYYLTTWNIPFAVIIFTFSRRLQSFSFFCRHFCCSLCRLHFKRLSEALPHCRHCRCLDTRAVERGLKNLFTAPFDTLDTFRFLRGFFVKKDLKTKKSKI